MSEALQLTNSNQNLSSIKVKTLSFKTPKLLYSMHRFLFRLTNGIWNDCVSKTLSILNGKYPKITLENSLFKSNDTEVQNIANQMRKEGYSKLPFKLPEDFIQSLHKFGENTPLHCVLPTDDYAKDGTIIENKDLYLHEVKNRFARCLYKSEDMMKNPTVQQIALDPTLLSIAQEYLGVKPILCSVVMWWSYPVKDIEKQAAAAAQEYHFDMDHFKFFNFFFYLNDVDENNGPHCYVKNSHKKLPPQFLKRGRFSDKDVNDHYKNDVVELTGPAGTMLAVDTRGLHKGKILKSGARLLLQVQFTNSLFGQYYDKTPFQNLSPEKNAIAHKYFESYFNYLPDSQ